MLFPTLIVSRDLLSLEKGFTERGWRVFDVDTVGDARETVRALRDITLSTPVALSDVSRLGTNQALLLKFIEESHHQLVLFASKDNLTRTLLSRVRQVIKDAEIVPQERNSPMSLKVPIAEGEPITNDLLISDCPQMAEFLFKLDRSGLPARGKILDLLLGAD